MKRTIALAVTTVFILGGCGTAKQATKQEAGSTPAAQATTPTPTATDTVPPAVEETTPTEEPSQEEPSISKVGTTEWFTYEDGVQVQVTKLARYTPSEYNLSDIPKGSVAVAATVTIKNGTDKTFDADLVSVNLATGPNGDQAETTYDSDRGIGSFEGSIPVKRSKTVKYGYVVPKAHLSQLVLEVTPSFDHAASFFQGSVK
jgi:hypothetical protein